MTVDMGHASDSDSGRDSDQMEIDIGNDKDRRSHSESNEYSEKENKGGERTKDSDVDIMEVDIVQTDDGKMLDLKKNDEDDSINSPKIENKSVESPILESTLKGNIGKIEYCGGCEAEVDDAEEGICCDGKCERWFHLRCSGLTQTEYDELGCDENAKWACNKCSGKPSPVIKPSEAKAPLTVRKNLGKISSSSPVRRKLPNKEGIVRTPKIDISNPAFLKPFDFGWKRELVYRSTNDNNNRRQGDIYYYTPKGKKLRSLREISDHLVGTDLTQDNFTFWKEPLGIEDPEKEIIRDAKLKLANKDSLSPSPVVIKKSLPKVPKTPKLTATVTPLEGSGGTVATTPKASASVTPRVVFKGKTNLGMGPKIKVTPSRNTPSGQPPKVVISKGSANTALIKNYSNSGHISSSTLKNRQYIIADCRAATSARKNPTIEGSEKNKIIEDIKNLNTRNRFRRYGLLANAKTPRKNVPNISLSSSSSSEDISDVSSEVETTAHSSGKNILPPSGIRIQKEVQNKQATFALSLHEQNTRGTSKVVCFNSRERNKMQHSKKKTESVVVRPLSNTTFSNKIILPPSCLESSILPSTSKRKPSSPEVQFRPCDPSYYGCQSNSVTLRPVGPNISSQSSLLYRTNINSGSNFETVLIVDPPSSTDNFLNSPLKNSDSSYESPLILNNSDCSIEIISVESLNTKDPVSKFEEGYLLASPSSRASAISVAKDLNTISENRGNRSDYMKGSVYSPVSVGSSSTEEIIVVDEDQPDNNSPPFLIRNSPPPKLVRNSSPLHRSPPNLQPIMNLPHLTPYPIQTDSRSFLPPPCSSKQNSGSSQNSSKAYEENIRLQKTASIYANIRKLKIERFYMRQKAKREMEKLKKSYTKEKELFVKRKSEEKRLRIKYLDLKVKMKELKMGLVKKKLEKL